MVRVLLIAAPAVQAVTGLALSALLSAAVAGMKRAVATSSSSSSSSSSGRRKEEGGLGKEEREGGEVSSRKSRDSDHDITNTHTNINTNTNTNTHTNTNTNTNTHTYTNANTNNTSTSTNSWSDYVRAVWHEIFAGLRPAWRVRSACGRRKCGSRSRSQSRSYPRRHLSLRVLSPPLGMAALLFVLLVVGRGLLHAIWMACDVYSAPTVFIPSFASYHGEWDAADDFRETYSWLAENTPRDATVMSWWDYGYQLGVMSGRRTLVDNHTWSHAHVARVARIFCLGEKEAWDALHEMQVDYVVVLYGGLALHTNDDVSKMEWMISIAAHEFTDIVPEEYMRFTNTHRPLPIDASGTQVMISISTEIILSLLRAPWSESLVKVKRIAWR